MALKLPGGGQRARANPTEVLIPDRYADYRDPYDLRWRGDKPYIGLGNAIRDEIREDLWTSVRWLQAGDLVDWGGVYRWTEKYFPGYDPDMDDGVHDVAGRAIRYLVKHGFLRTDSEFIFTRTSKPPQTAYSAFGNEAVKYRLKRLVEDREMLRQSFPDEIVAEVVNTAYDEGPTLEQYRFLDCLEPWERPHKLTDADYMNPSPELLALVEARRERYRLIKKERAAEQIETKRRHALIADRAPALQKLLANRGLSLPAYVRQQRREDETYNRRASSIRSSWFMRARQCRSRSKRRSSVSERCKARLAASCRLVSLHRQRYGLKPSLAIQPGIRSSVPSLPGMQFACRARCTHRPAATRLACRSMHHAQGRRISARISLACRAMPELAVIAGCDALGLLSFARPG